MTEHTPEPWPKPKVVSGPLGSSIFIKEIATINGDWPCAEANAARIVACVNACEGIDDPEDLRKQRDELLAACERIQHRYDTGKPNYCEKRERIMNIREEVDPTTYAELQALVYTISTSPISEYDFQNALSEVLRLSSCACRSYIHIL